VSEPAGPPCRHCATALPAGTVICPHCGAVQSSYGPRIGRPPLPAWRIVIGVLAAFLTVGFGALGACFLVFGSALGGGESGLWAVGAVLAVIGVVLLFITIRAFKR
jgi:hypothetical protein